MKEKVSVFFILFVTVLMAGCAVTTGKDGHTYVDGNCITCINNPLTGDAVNYKKTSEDYAKAEKFKVATGQSSGANDIPYEEGRIKFSVRTNIDKAYLKIKREFGYKTKAERARGMGPQGERWLDLVDSYRYEALPGVSYRMREHTTHNYKGRNDSQTIDAQLETNGAGTDIIITFWIKKPRLSLASFGNSLKSRVLNALR